MKKIYLLMEDRYHTRDVILPGMLAAFGEVDLVYSDNPEDIPWDTLQEDAALFISQKSEKQLLPDGSTLYWITDERAAALDRYVRGGGAALFIHSGLVGYTVDSQYYKLPGGLFLQHPPQCSLSFVPIGDHPILEGVEAFTAMDEHYFCQIDVSSVTPFLWGDCADHAAIVAGWCQEIGDGRTAVLVPGHTLEAATDPNMTRLARNAAKWVTRGAIDL